MMYKAKVAVYSNKKQKLLLFRLMEKKIYFGPK